jgi:8-hydroxy-5-deazaflavin:NADPH oxidoreductase
LHETGRARPQKRSKQSQAFNTLPAAILAADPTVEGGHRVLFISGNDAEANLEVASLAEKFGFAPIILGKLAEGGLLQQFGGPLTIQNLVKLDGSR